MFNIMLTLPFNNKICHVMLLRHFNITVLFQECEFMISKYIYLIIRHHQMVFFFPCNCQNV